MEFLKESVVKDLEFLFKDGPALAAHAAVAYVALLLLDVLEDGVPLELQQLSALLVVEIEPKLFYPLAFLGL